MSSRPHRSQRGKHGRRGKIPSGVRERVYRLLEFLAARVGRARPWASLGEIRAKLRNEDPDDLREALAKLTKKGVLLEQTTSARREWAIAVQIAPQRPPLQIEIDVDSHGL